MINMRQEKKGMTKKLKLFIYTLLCLFVFAGAVQAAPEIQVFINGKPVQDAVLLDGSVFVTFSTLREAVEVPINWDGASKIIAINEQPYVQLRPMVESLGGQVKWDEGTRTVEATLDTKSEVKAELVKVSTSDGIVLNGMVWTPASGQSSIGIILAAGTSDNFFANWLAWVGPKLAENGYLVVSLDRRDAGENFGYYNMEPSAMDHQYAIDLLQDRGAEVIITAGHSYGTVTTPYYVQATDDPRVKAMLLFAPLGDLRPASVIISGGQEKYDEFVAKSIEMVSAGKGKEAFLIPPMVPGGRPIVNTYENFLNKRGPDSQCVPVELFKSISGRPILGILDPGDPFPATKPPTREKLLSANKDLEYVLLSDIRNGGTDPLAHSFAGRESEVLKITLEWLAKQGLTP